MTLVNLMEAFSAIPQLYFQLLWEEDSLRLRLNDPIVHSPKVMIQDHLPSKVICLYAELSVLRARIVA
eukprot:CAMPEP_0115277640 /NCGR_PEP_ID=MMETSP0270-20121206/57346_1 /TAXON_ID=71861 /ORGANISM="Scrippsiella trochoidea, Strain CCMP3099" /LENGTH=67 /DNA_ID=CAMNT_0002694291 /DNA_START=395 /DNA_END=598 /DNA_ORIENTATION=+